jgi:hypothetical protein
VALASYKDLCIDANDPTLLGQWWGPRLGLEFHRQDSGDAYLTGPTKAHTIWINGVPEVKSVKHRIHLDVNADSLSEWSEGATIVDGDSFPWTVLLDPEGGEVCVFVRPHTKRLASIVVDAAQPIAIATWWADVLGARCEVFEQGYARVWEVPGAPFDSIDFIPVPEAKTVKNRLHIDVTTSSVSALVDAGASIVRAQDSEIRWTVCADPEGNEFCAFTT